MVTLQKILDAEFELEKESIIKHQREKKEQAAKQAGLQRKRMMLERQLREELSEIEKDHRIEFWLTLVRLLVVHINKTDEGDIYISGGKSPSIMKEVPIMYAKSTIVLVYKFTCFRLFREVGDQRVH